MDKKISESAFRGIMKDPQVKRLSFKPPVKGELHMNAINQVIANFRAFRHYNEESRKALITAFAVANGKANFADARKLKFTATHPNEFRKFLIQIKKINEQNRPATDTRRVSESKAN